LLAYIKFEERMSESQHCRDIMYRYLEAFPRLSTYLKVAKFEVKQKSYTDARKIYEKACRRFRYEAFREDYFLNLRFRNKTKRNRRYEKQVGSKENIDLLIFNKRRLNYKEKLAENQFNYDVWFDLLQLELCAGNRKTIQDTFEAVIAKVPSVEEKRFWRRYIYLFYSYAVSLELDYQDIEAAQRVLEQAMKSVPHKKFSFQSFGLNWFI